MIFQDKKIIRSKFSQSIENAEEIINGSQLFSLDSLDHPIYRVIHIFARSMQAQFLQEIITTHEYKIPHQRDIHLFHPEYSLLKENGIPLLIYENVDLSENVNIDFNKDVVFSFPWSFSRFRSALSNLNRGDWKYDGLNHRAYYLEPFKIGVMHNGLHSSSVGILFNQGTMPAQVIDMSSLYEWIYSDGLNFYSIKTNKKIAKVASFEEAVIFEIGRLIHNKKNY